MLRNDYQGSNTCNRGERDTYHSIKSAFLSQMPMARVMSNVILPMELQDQSKAPATAEYDVIAVTPYGVIVFEVKDWKGWRVSRGSPTVNGHQWLLEFEENGAKEERRNPVHQCYGKTRHLSESLGFWTTSYVVLTDNNLIVDHHLGAYVIQQKEIDYIPRLIRHISKKIRSAGIPDSIIDKVADSILETSTGITQEQHIANVTAYLSLKNAVPSL